jgi:hypothetical protein
MSTVRFKGVQGTKLWEVVIDLFEDAGASPGDIAETARDAVWASLRPRTSSGCTLQSIQVGDSATGAELPVLENGANPAFSLPSNCSVLITKVVTGSRNGRMFWPGLPEADVNAGGQLEAAALPLWQTAANNVMTALAANGTVMRVIDATDDPHVVSALSVQPLIGTQRRRLRN